MSNLGRLNSILLVDDDEASNFLHSIFINKLDLDVEINSALNGQEALDFILGKGQNELELPCMVMLDLRMPIMDGWQFMKSYEELVPKKLKEDKDRAVTNEFIADFSQKPLSDDMFKQLIQKHFSLATT